MTLTIVSLTWILIGLYFAKTDSASTPNAKFDAWTIILWPFGIDIRAKSLIYLYRIERERRRVIETIARTDLEFRIVGSAWVDENQYEAVITVLYKGEMRQWRGSSTVWNCASEGTRAATWLEAKLSEQWTKDRNAAMNRQASLRWCAESKRTEKHR